jgi:hypothetical protein
VYIVMGLIYQVHNDERKILHIYTT